MDKRIDQGVDVAGIPMVGRGDGLQLARVLAGSLEGRDVEAEIMRCIREEAARRRSARAVSGHMQSVRMMQSESIDGSPMKLRVSVVDRLNPATWRSPLPRWRPTVAPFVQKKQYVLSDLLVFSDAEFIDAVFRAVLRRAPSASEMPGQLARLRSRITTKVEIIGAVRWSPEGVAAGVHIDGLLVPYKLRSWFRLPVVGPMIRWAHAFVRLGGLFDRQIGVNETHEREMAQFVGHMNDQTAAIEERLGELTEISSHYQSLLQMLRDCRKELAELNDTIKQQRTLFEQRLEDVDSKGERRHAVLGQRLEMVASGSEALSEQQKQHIRRMDSLEERAGASASTLQLLNSRMDHNDERAANLQELDRRIQKVEKILPTIGQWEFRKRIEAEADHDFDGFYAAFEDRFRGDMDTVRARLMPYIEIVRESGAGTLAAPVLDVGCGRGEWLDLLRDNNLVGRGIDINNLFIASCRKRGLDVMEGDALALLADMPDASFGALTSTHLVEHLQHKQLIALVDEARRVLRPGGVLILETPNPENISVGAHTFYMDPTHRNPIPPESLRWTVEARGFFDVRIERLTEAREMNVPEPVADDVPGAEGINCLLASLRAAPDYAIIARKP